MGISVPSLDGQHMTLNISVVEWVLDSCPLPDNLEKNAASRMMDTPYQKWWMGIFFGIFFPLKEGKTELDMALEKWGGCPRKATFCFLYLRTDVKYERSVLSFLPSPIQSHLFSTGIISLYFDMTFAWLCDGLLIVHSEINREILCTFLQK